MSVSRGRIGRPIMAVSVAVALAVAVATPVLATGSATGPSYRAVVAPSSLAAGTATTSTITLTQVIGDDSYHSRELGSVRITPPAGFVLTGATAVRGSSALPVSIASGVVTVNNVDLDNAGQTATVTLVATIPCGVSGAAGWTVVGHSTYSYDSTKAKTLVQDPASQLASTVAPCSLAFATQPTAAAVGKVITGVAADPSGSPVAVQLRDGNGAAEPAAGLAIELTIESGTGTAGAVLGGTLNATTDGTGRATFAPTIDRPGHDYALHAAAAPGISQATSAAFDVSSVAVVCSGACSGSDQLGNTSATVSATSNGGVLSMSVGLDTVDCNNAVNHNYVSTSQAVTFDVTPAVGRTTITMKLAAASVTRPFYKYEVCFSSPNSTFVNKYGATIAAGQAGILPQCVNCDKPTGGPCLLLRWFDLRGNVYVKFSVPSGDPRGKI
jgi:hypothetical protein